MPDGATAELKALLEAFEYISTSENEKFIIFTDSLSSLQALQGNLRNPMLLQLLEKYQSLKDRKTIRLCWIPSHIGIPGNEAADRAAKTALGLPITEMEIHYSDFKPLIKYYIDQLWQVRWRQQTRNKLYTIRPQIQKRILHRNLNRREEIVLTRLKIGHTFFTHSYLLKKEAKPQCKACKCDLTVEHILISCEDVSETRTKYYNVDNMMQLFQEVNTRKIFDYLHEVGIFRRV